MQPTIVLASGSEIRSQLLWQAAVSHDVKVARVDEDAIKQSLLAEGASPRDIADALAEAKARKVSASMPDRLVLGCDQVLAFGDKILSKPCTPKEALEHLHLLRGQRHQLLSAAVLYE